MRLPDCPLWHWRPEQHSRRTKDPALACESRCGFFPANLDDVRKKMYICGVNDLIKNKIFYIIKNNHEETFTCISDDASAIICPGRCRRD